MLLVVRCVLTVGCCLVFLVSWLLLVGVVVVMCWFMFAVWCVLFVVPVLVLFGDRRCLRCVVVC